jgi:hypothetical protein
MSENTLTVSPQIIVEQSHYIYAATKLGRKILTGGATQILIESDNTFIDMFEVHEMNRNIDEQWVKEMKTEVLKTSIAKECMAITLAVDERMIRRAMTEPDNSEQDGGFKAIILDGQHRVAAMKALKYEMPSLSYDIWLTVYIVEDDNAIIKRLEELNKRRPFTQDDTNKLYVVKRFMEAFEQLHKKENETRRCIQNVRKSPIIKSLTFIKKHNNTSVNEFITKIQNISIQYKSRWNTIVDNNSKIQNLVLGQVINRTKLFQLCDETHNWINEI